MPKGVYAAASSMYVDRFTVEVLANNIANAQTAGFKRAVPLRESFAAELTRRQQEGGLAGDGAAGVAFDGTYTQFRDGPLVQTNDSLDAALHGDAFYLVEDAGRQRLTRHAHFVVDETGLLQTDTGLPAIGQGGPIRIPAAASDIDIDNQGRIYAVMPGDEGPQRAFIEQFRVVTVADRAALHKIDGQFYDPGDQALIDSDDYQVRQGFLEEANTQPVSEMVEMIAAQRRYDLAQRALNEQLSGTYSDILRG